MSGGRKDFDAFLNSVFAVVGVITKNPDIFKDRRIELTPDGQLSPDQELRLAIASEDDSFKSSLSIVLNNGKDPDVEPGPALSDDTGQVIRN